MAVTQVHVEDSEVWVKGHLWVSRGAYGSSSGELRRTALPSEASVLMMGSLSGKGEQGHGGKVGSSHHSQPCPHKPPSLSSNPSFGKGPWEGSSALLTSTGGGPRHSHPSPTFPVAYAASPAMQGLLQSPRAG